MSSLLQHLLVLAISLGCACVVLWQAVRTLRGRGKLGACCAKGCDASEKPASSTDTRAQFLPLEMLSRRR
ncbi:MAG: hypothetical protein ACREJC_07395 [Tepidisphaeraceae bacterium]